MTGRASRDKGARAERECVKLLGGLLGLELSRNFKQWGQGQEGDIAELVGPYCVEAKFHAAESLKPWWAQVCAAARKRNAVPCLAVKTARKGWRFLVPLPQAWATGQAWAWELTYTMTLSPDGFALVVREQMQ